MGVDMASLRQRPGPGGRRVWQVRIKRKGYPEAARTFDLKTEAEATSLTEGLERAVSGRDRPHKEAVESRAAASG